MLIRTEIGIDAAGIDNLLRHSSDTEQRADNIHSLRENGLLTLGVVATDDEGQIMGYAAFSPILVQGEDSGWVTLAALAAADPNDQQLLERIVYEGLDSLNEFSYQAVVAYEWQTWLKTLGFKSAKGLTFVEGQGAELVVYGLVESDAVNRSAVLSLPMVA